MHPSRKNQNLLGRWLSGGRKGKKDEGAESESNGVPTSSISVDDISNSGNNSTTTSGSSVRLLQQLQASQGDFSEGSNASEDLSMVSKEEQKQQPHLLRLRRAPQSSSLLDDSFSEDWEHPLRQVSSPIITTSIGTGAGTGQSSTIYTASAASDICSPPSPPSRVPSNSYNKKPQSTSGQQQRARTGTKAPRSVASTSSTGCSSVSTSATTPKAGSRVTLASVNSSKTVGTDRSASISTETEVRKGEGNSQRTSSLRALSQVPVLSPGTSKDDEVDIRMSVSSNHSKVRKERQHLPPERLPPSQPGVGRAEHSVDDAFTSNVEQQSRSKSKSSKLTKAANAAKGSDDNLIPKISNSSTKSKGTVSSREKQSIHEKKHNTANVEFGPQVVPRFPSPTPLRKKPMNDPETTTFTPHFPPPTPLRLPPEFPPPTPLRSPPVDDATISKRYNWQESHENTLRTDYLSRRETEQRQQIELNLQSTFESTNDNEAKLQRSLATDAHRALNLESRTSIKDHALKSGMQSPCGIPLSESSLLAEQYTQSGNKFVDGNRNERPQHKFCPSQDNEIVGSSFSDDNSEQLHRQKLGHPLIHHQMQQQQISFSSPTGRIVGVPLTNYEVSCRNVGYDANLGLSSASLAISDLMDDGPDAEPFAVSAHTSKQSWNSNNNNNKSATSLSFESFAGRGDLKKEEVIANAYLRRVSSNTQQSGLPVANAAVATHQKNSHIDHDHDDAFHAYANTNQCDEYLEDPSNNQRYAPPSRSNANVRYVNASYHQPLQSHEVAPLPMHPLPSNCYVTHGTMSLQPGGIFNVPSSHYMQVEDDEDDEDDEISAHMQEHIRQDVLQESIRTPLNIAVSQYRSGTSTGIHSIGSAASSFAPSTGQVSMRGSESSASSRSSCRFIPQPQAQPPLNSTISMQTSAQSLKIDELIDAEGISVQTPHSYHQEEQREFPTSVGAIGQRYSPYQHNEANFSGPNSVEEVTDVSYNAERHMGNQLKYTVGRSTDYNTDASFDYGRNSASTAYSDVNIYNNDQTNGIPISSIVVGDIPPPSALRSEFMTTGVTSLGSVSSSASGRWNHTDEVGSARTTRSFFTNEDEEYIAMQQEEEMIELAMQRSMEGSESVASSGFWSASGMSARSNWNDNINFSNQFSRSNNSIDQVEQEPHFRDLPDRSQFSRKDKTNRSKSLTATLIQNPLNSLLRQMGDHDNEDDDDYDYLNGQMPTHTEEWTSLPPTLQQHQFPESFRHQSTLTRHVSDQPATARTFDGRSRPIYAWERDLIAHESEQNDRSRTVPAREMYEGDDNAYGVNGSWNENLTAHTSNRHLNNKHWLREVARTESGESFASQGLLPQRHNLLEASTANEGVSWPSQEQEFMHQEPYYVQHMTPSDQRLVAGKEWMRHSSLHQLGPSVSRETEAQCLARVEKEMFELAMHRSLANENLHDSR